VKLHSSAVFGILLLISGCNKTPPPTSTPKGSKKENAPIKTRVSNRPGNLDGSVLIVEYHKIAKEEARWDRSINRYKSDLQRLYKSGFRPVTLGEYLDNKMDLPPGASPVVFTWDDSHPSQFKLREDGTLDPDCGLGIWEGFTKEHPDFPIKATFFILPDSGPWGQPKLADKKFEMLKAWGCEVASHTITHRQLSKISESEVKSELSKAIDYIQSKGFTCRSIALPYGISPKNKALLKSFTLNGKTYSHEAALLVGSNPAPAPGSLKRDPMRLPRIQSIEGDFGLTYWLDRIDKGQVKRFVQP